MERLAEISGCGRYRYTLQRLWAPSLLQPLRGPGGVCWVMLNPSTADAEADDPTIRRCIGYSAAWGFQKLVVVNLCAYRATKPAEMLALPHAERFGPDNRRWLRRQLWDASLVLFGWGAHGEALPHEVGIVRELMDNYTAYCLGTTQSGQPRHPLYMRKDIGLNDLQAWPS